MSPKISLVLLICSCVVLGLAYADSKQQELSQPAVHPEWYTQPKKIKSARRVFAYNTDMTPDTGADTTTVTDTTTDAETTTDTNTDADTTTDEETTTDANTTTDAETTTDEETIADADTTTDAETTADADTTTVTQESITERSNDEDHKEEDETPTHKPLAANIPDMMEIRQ